MLDTCKDIENIVIFISDALRWDNLPEEVQQMGYTFKMVAASSCTAPSLTSLVTGLHPFRHNVFTFQHILSKEFFNVLDLPGYNTTFRTENTWTGYDSFQYNPIFRMLRQKKSISLKDIQPPFIYIEDEKGGHCPYGWHEDDVYEEGDCISFFRDYGKREISEMVERYEQGIERSVKEFKQRIKILERRNLLDKTLIIFLSDHGEFLGEHGNIIGHGNMLAPLIAYVPLVFIHPNIKKGQEKEGVARHVDIVPTILGMIGQSSTQSFDGKSLLKNKPSNFGYSYWKYEATKRIWKKELKIQFDERAIWTDSGGISIRSKNGKMNRILKCANDVFNGDNIQSIYIRNRFKKHPIKTIIQFPKLLKRYLKTKEVFQDPGISIKEIEQIIENIEKSKIVFDERHSLKKSIMNLKLKGKF